MDQLEDILYGTEDTPARMPTLAELIELFYVEEPPPADWEGYPHDDLYYYKYYGDPERFQRRQHSFSWFGPTRVGVTLAYDLLYRRIQKKRASFRPWEDITIISSDRNINE